MKVASKMGVEGNAMASLEFIDSVCTAVKDGKIVDVSTEKTKMVKRPRFLPVTFCQI